ncbi:MAG TPA: BON domain-containing protein [Pirellulales bacterium]|jgi:osmotically-inducible protein OsmY|nr:BON domain-containing protein [Pirellulales bacterium]
MMQPNATLHREKWAIREVVRMRLPVDDASLRVNRRVMHYLRSRLIPGAESVYVQTCLGTAIVQGRVASEAARRRICDCCRNVAGVFNVIDRIEVVA